MKKIIWTTAIRLNELLSSELWAVSDLYRDFSILITNDNALANVYIDNSYEQVLTDSDNGFPLKQWEVIYIESKKMSFFSLVADQPNTEIRILFI
jgi:hypothetical protein